MYRHNNLSLKFRKKLPINSLEAAICNVALFKNMKEKQFRDQIFISYCEDGVLLDAYSQEDWNQACKYTDNFLKKKKIALLTYGFEREAYQQLIIKGLKDFTRKIKERGEECPYINIIHYQKLRKSCEYMDKERYSDPLKDWQKKNKSKPNFAFLIVEPRSRFEQVKRSLLEYLLNKPVALNVSYLPPMEFIYTFFNSPAKALLKEALTKCMLQITMEQKQDPKQINQKQHYNQKAIRVANYTDIDIQEYQVYPMKANKNISKLGLQFISSNDVKNQALNVKTFIRQGNVQTVFQKMQKGLLQEYGQNYVMIPYKKSQREKSLQLINKFTNMKYSKDQLYHNLKKFVICQYTDIQFISVIGQATKQKGTKLSDSKVSSSNSYIIHKASINGCPFMLHEYPWVKQQDLDTFMIYLDQLWLYYNNYMVRFYGICQHPDKPYTYFLVFDYQAKSLAQMLQHGQIIDDCQVGNMILQILYLIKYVQTHDQPRCIGRLSLDQIYWPMCVVLPYLSQNHQNSIESDIKIVGQCMKELLGQRSQDFDDVIKQMLRENKYDRITLTKCIGRFQQILAI